LLPAGQKFTADGDAKLVLCLCGQTDMRQQERGAEKLFDHVSYMG